MIELILIASAKIWFIIFSIYLVLYTSLFSYVPYTIIGVALVFVLLYHFRVPLPPARIVAAIFGEHQTTSQDISTSSQSDGITEANQPNGNANVGRDRLWIVGHRGCGLDAPENTLIAFTKCAERGGNSVEFDITLTKDCVPILFHDDNLLRMTGIDREISDVNYCDLERFDMATKHPLVNKLERPIRIPTLDEAVETCLAGGLRFFIDIKARDSKIVDVVLETYRKYPAMYENAVVSSFDPKIIFDIRRSDNNIVGCMAWRPGYCRYKGWESCGDILEKRHSLFLMDWLSILMDYALTWSVKNFLWWFVGLSAILIHKDGITKEEIHKWKRLDGPILFLWTVNNPIEKLHTSETLRVGYLTDTMDGDFSISGSGSLNSSRTSEHQPRLASRSSDLFVTPKLSTDGN